MESSNLSSATGPLGLLWRRRTGHGRAVELSIGNHVLGPDGTLYIADQNNGRVRAVSPTRRHLTIAGNGLHFLDGCLTERRPSRHRSSRSRRHLGQADCCT